MEGRKPNFFIIGQTKAGTSSMHNYLEQHPQVYVPSFKELRYFSHDLSVPVHARKIRAGYPVTQADYEKHFEAVRGKTAVGEASPQYFESPHAAGQIHRYAADAKIICCFRNPVDRLYSLHQMHTRVGDECREFSEAFIADKRGAPWVCAGFSFENIRRFYDVFDRSQVLAIKFDDFSSDPAATMRQIFNFLAVDPDAEIDTTVIHNKGGIPKNQAIYRFSRFITRHVTFRSTAKQILPDAAVSAWRRIRNANLSESPAISDDLRREITRFYAEDILRTEELVDLDFQNWLIDY